MIGLEAILVGCMSSQIDIGIVEVGESVVERI